MNLVEEMIFNRVTVLLDEVQSIAESLIDEGEDKKRSTKVADLTTVGQIPPVTLRRLGVVQLQISLLKGML